MIKLVVTNEKNLELYELEKVHVGENKFGYYLIFLPEMLNGYNLSDCEVKLIQIFEDNTSVSIDVDTTQETRPIKKFITLDATAQAQTVTLSVLVTHNGDVIGKTNQKTYQVYPTKNATPIDPREELDEIIAELRAENAELSETVSTQAEQIAQDEQTISGLNTQVSTLTTQNQEQAATITRQNTTIDELNERRIPVYIEPQLVPKEVTPQLTNQYIEPPEGKNGFNAISVNPITPDLVPNCEPQNIAKGATILGVPGTFDSFPENPVGGIYFYEPDENDNPTKCKIYKWRETTWGSLLKNNLYAYVENVVFEETLITTISDNAFENCTGLKNIVLDNSILNISNSAFRNCTNLVAVEFGNDILTIGANAFQNTGLSSIILPASVQSVSAQAFYGSRLVTAKVLSGVVGNTAFNNCTQLTEIEFGNNVTSIGYQCCTYTALNTVKLSEGLTTIGDWAFGRVTIKTINFPSTLISVGASSFAYCSSLENVTFANGFNCNNLNLSYSTLYSVETIVSCLEALADRTGQTAYTITFGSTNLNKLTNEQKAIATNKNWNLA